MANIYRMDKDGNLVLVQRDTDSQVEQNTNQVTNLLERVNSLEAIVPDNYTALNNKIDKNTDNISVNANAITALINTVSQNAYDLQTKINQLDSKTDTSITLLKEKCTVLETASNYITAYEGGLNG